MTNNSHDRIVWVDCIKGFAILSVIAGHTFTNHILRGLIFSFHMPLFFMLSGYTSHSEINKNQIYSKMCKLFFALIIPAYIIYFIRIPFFILKI